MSYITPNQAAHQRRISAQTLTDTCQRLVYTEGSGDYGYGTPTYPAGTSSPCLFVEQASQDAQGQSAVPMADAKLYLPITFALTPNDRVKITHLYGMAVGSPQTYAIVKGPIIGHNVMSAELQLVTDGSDE